MISKNQIKHIRQLEIKKYRQREGLFVAEGPKVVGDLMKAGYSPKELYAVEDFQGAVHTIQTVSQDELCKISFLQHPQQVLGVFRIPSQDSKLPSPDGRLSLALDGIQDPGNLGTIIRIADWFGISTIYCSEDTADAWNPKVVQATMGSIARVNIVYTSLQEIIQQASVPVYGTLLDGNDIYQQPLSKEGIIVMGNEGNGISPEIRQMITRKLLIPSFHQGDTAESLNVAIATAITCSEFRRREYK
ncbi:MAG: RNA methyltransferase [Prevotella sp.]|jgi:TrmH family RNA methyltransferase|nr:RNA methyltransferase [Prevotella sp.]